MNNTISASSILEVNFDKRRTKKLITYFSNSMREFEKGSWENALEQSGKFVETTIKLIWDFAKETLPKEKEFKAGAYAKKIMQLNSNKIPHDGIRLQIPRACVFLYDIVSNRGGRHVSDEFDPNEMDAMTVSALCSWILAELVRFCASNTISHDEAKKIVESVIARRYPFFEEIEGRIYVDDKKHKNANECALMILYKKFPKRMKRTELVTAVTKHKYKKSSIRFERLSSFIDFDANHNILLRGTGRRKVDELLAKHGRGI